jgi:Zn-dependent protease/CBS domain-containing protein
MARTAPRAALAWLRRHRGIPLFTVFGIRIIADQSWFLIVALITGTLAVGLFPLEVPGKSVLSYALLGLITAFFFFASVLVHELAHSIVAVLNGIPVRRITLFLFGGLAEITREPSTPGTELRIALAGPATSATIAAVLWGAWLALGADSARPGLRLAIEYLAWANSVLLAFNVLPGLPLDGGRVLRAIIWHATRNLRRATYIASVSGKALAGLLIVAGIVAVLTRTYIISGLWFIFIALFLRQAADRSYRQVVMREALAGIRVSSVMSREVVTVSPGVTLADFIESFVLRHHFTSYPVVEDGRPLGIISTRLVKRVPRERWAATAVGAAMIPLSRENTLAPEDGIPAALQKMGASGLSKLPVLEDGRILGMVTRRDITSYLEIRSDLER